MLLIGWISWYLIESRWIIKTNMYLIKSLASGDMMLDSSQDKILAFSASMLWKLKGGGGAGELNPVESLIRMYVETVQS